MSWKCKLFGHKFIDLATPTNIIILMFLGRLTFVMCQRCGYQMLKVPVEKYGHFFYSFEEIAKEMVKRGMTTK